MRAFRWLILAAVLAAAAGWWITRARPLPADALASLAGEAARGETVFLAAGCASCHAAPKATEGAEGAEDKPILSGGQQFASDFGTFVAPNISPDPVHGIGGWTVAQFATALKRGVSPEGRHYYPAFPYTAYVRMRDQDIADLWAFWQTLPASDAPSQPHEVGFPFSIRRAVGVWKLLYLRDDWVMGGDADPQLERGRYLVEALAHCGECHTPRGPLGGLDTARWLAGAPNPSGKGTIPSLTPDRLTWDAGEIAYYLETGFTPDYDSAGGHMAAVVGNFGKLTSADRAAVAAYVKALPRPAE
ncbi:c-type cytochrome [Antarcticimicrobium luteum]|uniref:C-type cytochrome n=1 Tax=Antarcticimicrobium luteum TaxID=2547397 RepID=A0A4V3AR25_9RHOB|nr:cytochrome c [Antarcticimicrobium luteum]TDK44967.1 c-type cytochrome [Antarcticimicrobium luteum]